MQNRYVGDVGDFGKYGLLRSLGAGKSLGVVWYLTADEGHNADGKHVSFLNGSAANRTSYRGCDPDLYDTLAGIVLEGERSVESVRESGVLPTGTVVHDEILTFEGMPANGLRAREARLNHRRRWVDRALHATRESDMVFLDPDNGLENAGTKRHHKRGPKYVYIDEVQPYLTRGQSVILYHHLCRNGSAPQQVASVCARLGERLDGFQHLSALLYRRGTVRAFVVISASSHEANLTEKICRFMDEPWSRHFEYSKESGGLIAV